MPSTKTPKAIVDGDSDDEETPLVVHASRMASSLRYSYGSPSFGGPIVSVKQRPHHISTRLRWLTNGSGLLCVFLFSGIIYGWAPFKLMLKREGQYGALCGDTAATCVDQTVRFNRIFTAAQFFLSFASLPVGFFLDHASKVTHYIVAALLEIVGLLLLVYADYTTETSDADIPWMDQFFIGYTLLALGGGMAMMGAFPASFLLPEYQGGILAAVSCLFDASTIVFAVMTPLNAQHPVVLSRQHLLSGYAALAAVLFGVLATCWSILEKHHWKLVVEMESSGTGAEAATDNKDYGATTDALLEVEEENDVDNINAASTASSNGESSSTKIDPHTRRVQLMGFHNWSLMQQLGTLDFAVVLVFASVQMLRCNFYIETVNELLHHIAPGQAAVEYAQIFSFVLPLGVVFVPIIDGAVKRMGIVNTLHFTNFLGAVFGTLLLIPHLWAQALNFIVFTGFRAFLYATLNTYIAVTFGVSTMGRVIGAAFTTAAVATLLQYPAATLAEDDYGGDFTVVNIMFLTAGVVLPGGLALYYDRVVRRTPATAKVTVY